MRDICSHLKNRSYMHMEKRRKTWSSIRYGSMRIPERSRKQLRNRTTDGLFGIMPCRKPIRSLTSGTWRHFGLAFSSVFEVLPFNTKLVRCGNKYDLTCPLWQGRSTTEHARSSCKIAFSQGQYMIESFRELRLKERLSQN